MTIETSNTQILFNAIPRGLPQTTDFKVQNSSFDIDQKLPENTIIVKTSWLSLDPYMRGRMRKAGTESYASPFELNKPLTAGAVGEVVRSNSSKYNVGDVVLAHLDWASYSVVNEKAVQSKIDQEKFSKFPLQSWLGLLGMPSFTAYIGLVILSSPKAGETLFVSAAAGAVGQVVGQIGKKLGLKVVGSAGSDEKVKYLKEKLGFDEAFNYKTEAILETLKRLCPKGIDIYFENVGGEQLEAALEVMNLKGRIPTCGMISQYNGAGYGVKNLLNIIAKRLMMQGFIVSDHYEQHYAEFLGWMMENTKENFVYETTVSAGIETAPDAFIGLLQGKNLGKQLIRL